MSIEDTIEKAYLSKVTDLYNQLFQAMASANGDDAEIASAEARFSKGLVLAAETKRRANRLSNA